eukprot:COSAG04_NODE_28606_length_274_cov_1.165714_1_plen_33_part_10
MRRTALGAALVLPSLARPLLPVLIAFASFAAAA